MADANPEMPSLTVAGGPLDGYEMKLSPGTTVIIGSGRLAHMRIDHPDIELAHVKVAWDDIGISMVDNGSRKGTWVNGEPVETVALLDGDVIEFTAPDSKSKPPKVKVRIPKGSVPEPPPLPPPAPGEVAVRPVSVRAAAPRPRGPARRRRAGPSLPDLRLVGVAAAAIVLLVGGVLLVRRVFFTAPQLVSVEPGQAEPGQTVTIRGKRFRSDAADNTVWFGELSVPPQSVSGDVLRVEEGSLYPALHRMEEAGWIKAKWVTTASNRRARIYEITTKGAKQLSEEEARWRSITSAVGQVLQRV